VSRSQRICSAMPTWALELVLRMPTMTGLWGAAYVELWTREIEPLLESPPDESGPWPVSIPCGWH
jgi:hypothetical protein